MKSIVITEETAQRDGNCGRADSLFCILYNEEYQASYREPDKGIPPGVSKTGREDGQSI